MSTSVSHSTVYLFIITPIIEMIKISPKIDTKEVEKIFNSHSASMIMNVPGNIN